MNKQYADRNPMELDNAGGYNIRHLSAMTREKLHGKFEIAGELGYRDMVIDDIIAALDKAAMMFAHYEVYHAEKGAIDKSTANGEYKQMCLDAISKARGNV
jgi:hypothetical protein